MSEHVKTENESDTLEVQSVLWHEKHEQIKWQRTRIATLEAQLAEARKAIVSAINILECEHGYSMAKGNFPMLYAAIEAVGKEVEDL